MAEYFTAAANQPWTWRPPIPQPATTSFVALVFDNATGLVVGRIRYVKYETDPVITVLCAWLAAFAVSFSAFAVIVLLCHDIVLVRQISRALVKAKYFALDKIEVVLQFLINYRILKAFVALDRDRQRSAMSARSNQANQPIEETPGVLRLAIVDSGVNGQQGVPHATSEEPVLRGHGRERRLFHRGHRILALDAGLPSERPMSFRRPAWERPYSRRPTDDFNKDFRTPCGRGCSHVDADKRSLSSSGSFSSPQQF